MYEKFAYDLIQIAIKTFRWKTQVTSAPEYWCSVVQSEVKYKLQQQEVK